MDRRGFTLLEMVVATAIMGIAVVGLLSSLAASARNAARLRDYDRVAQLAELRMNDMLLDEDLPRDSELSGAFDPAISGGLESGWRARLTAFAMPPARAPGQYSLDRIEMEVWWTVAGHRRSISVEAYRRHILKPEDIPPVVTP
jgi:general secretion pathway protein I